MNALATNSSKDATKEETKMTNINYGTIWQAVDLINSQDIKIKELEAEVARLTKVLEETIGHIHMATYQLQDYIPGYTNNTNLPNKEKT